MDAQESSENRPEPGAPRKPGFTGKRHTGGKRGTRKPSKVLMDMLHVHNKPKAEDVTQGQKSYRVIAEKDLGDFLSRLQRAEQAHKAGNAPTAADGTVIEDDESEERVTILLEKLLEEMNKAGYVDAE